MSFLHKHFLPKVNSLCYKKMPPVFRTGAADSQRFLAQNGPQAMAHASDRVHPVGHMFRVVTSGLCLWEHPHSETDHTVSLVS